MATLEIGETRPLTADEHGSDNVLPGPSSSAALSSSRNHALDNLRTFLTTLVILHHTAIAYGGSGQWWIRSQCFPSESIILLTFNAINQSFFMALFFFLSRPFTRNQMTKQGATRSTVVRSRLIRILFPALVYTLLVEPTLSVIVWIWTKGTSQATLVNVWSVPFLLGASLRYQRTGLVPGACIDIRRGRNSLSVECEASKL